MDKTKIIVVEDNIVYCEFVCNMLVQLVVEFTEHGYVAVDVRFHHILEDVAHLVVPALLRCRLVSSLCRHIAVVLIFCF